MPGRRTVVPDPLKLGAGSVGAPTYSFSADATTGLYRGAASQLDLALGGQNVFRFHGTNGFQTLAPIVLSNTALRWGPGAFAAGDTVILREAIGVLALKNGTTQHTLRVYGTTSGGDKYLILTHDGTDASIGASSGILKVTTTALALGTNPSATGVIRLPNTAGIYWRNASNSGDLNAIAVNGSNQLLLGSGDMEVWIANAGASKLGFFSTAPAVLQTVTGSKGGNAALTSLIAALVAYGLIADTTT